MPKKFTLCGTHGPFSCMPLPDAARPVSPGTPPGYARPGSDPTRAGGASLLASNPAVARTVRPVELAQRGGPTQRHGLPFPPTQAPGAGLDRVAPAPTPCGQWPAQPPWGGGPMTRPRSRPSWRRCGPCGWNPSGLPARIWGYSKGCCSSNIIAVRGLRRRRDSELVEGDFCQEAGQVTCFKFGPDRKFVPLWREVWKSGTNGFERISSEPQNQSQPGSAAKQKIPLSHLLGVNGCTKLWPPFE